MRELLTLELTFLWSYLLPIPTNDGRDRRTVFVVTNQGRKIVLRWDREQVNLRNQWGLKEVMTLVEVSNVNSKKNLIQLFSTKDNYCWFFRIVYCWKGPKWRNKKTEYIVRWKGNSRPSPVIWKRIYLWVAGYITDGILSTTVHSSTC